MAHNACMCTQQRQPESHKGLQGETHTGTYEMGLLYMGTISDVPELSAILVKTW